MKPQTIPFEQVRTQVYNTLDEFDNVKLTVNIGFAEPIASWFMEHCGYLPPIYVSRADFEDPHYWIELPSDILVAYNIVWS